jgi:hypothetical protein
LQQKETVTCKGNYMRECITHHHACECREEAIRKFIVELLAYLQQDMPLAKHTELWETAVSLGYVKPFARY